MDLLRSVSVLASSARIVGRSETAVPVIFCGVSSQYQPITMRTTTIRLYTHGSYGTRRKYARAGHWSSSRG
eukprot:902602-Prymnesium_polylepis.1